MRIAVLVNAYPPSSDGGAAMVAHAQVELLREHGHDVRVWVREPSWRSSLGLIRLVHHLFDLGKNSTIIEEIAQWKPDVLLTHNLTGCGFGTPKAIQKRGIRWVHALHDVQLFEPSGWLKRPEIVTRWQGCWARMRSVSLGSPDVVLSPTEWLIGLHRMRGLFSQPSTSVRCLPNPAPRSEECVRSIHAPLQLLFVGRIAPEKGSRLLLQLLERSSDGDFVLTIVGGGSDARLFRDRPCVRCIGLQKTEEVLRLMRESDALLVPSVIQENQPQVILEAASVGLPVIASDQGGIKETLDGRGILCPPEDVDAWLSAISELTRTTRYEREVREMIVLAQRYDREHYSTELEAVLKSNR